MSELENCLAYQVLSNPDQWLSSKDLSELNIFLEGAENRAMVCGFQFPHWRICGVLNDEEFYLPLLDRTGQRNSSARWEHAIKYSVLDQEEGFNALRAEFLKYFSAHGFGGSAWSGSEPVMKAKDFWSRFAKRPGMYMGRSDGEAFRWFLNGMSNGGDWLGLPEMPRLMDVCRRLEEASIQRFGNSFAIFRAVEMKALLEICGFSSPQSSA